MKLSLADPLNRAVYFVRSLGKRNMNFLAVFLWPPLIVTKFNLFRIVCFSVVDLSTQLYMATLSPSWVVTIWKAFWILLLAVNNCSKGLNCFASPFPLSPGYAAVVLGPVQTATTLLDVWTPCCMLFCVVGSCCTKFETGQTFSYLQMLGVVGQHFRVCLHRALNLLQILICHLCISFEFFRYNKWSCPDCSDSKIFFK